MQKRSLRRRLASLACASFVAFTGGAFASDLSDPAFVHLTPETSSFWHTATNATLTVPIDFPFGATSGTMRICRSGYFSSQNNYCRTQNVHIQYTPTTGNSVTGARIFCRIPNED